MGYAEAQLMIHAPINEVWDTLNDINHTAKWVTGLERTEIVAKGLLGKGSIYNDYNRLGWMLQVTTWHVTEFEPMSRQVHISASAGLPSTMTLTLVATPDGTYVQFKVDFRFMPRWGFASRLFERVVINKVLSGLLLQNLQQLDRYLKTGVGAWQAISHYG